eukprot:CAMPEP_0174373566 /NCGR_PEP_ID=MMETSP0811_2-20130205/107686_1 /TAXON_ID=73025 ORGANISM="Eutreptiella gymnastica-like, Strain CCMP1594" /NCGR_SAMPLE_ID=MMETSP0811_2 /ASSEMBLY_ACC=CAM_ASM_000667 /LENGTH=42 /DNA_ID= /DNA_START= /DNA_END= /DNA_ORIENTATION=
MGKLWGRGGGGAWALVGPEREPHPGPLSEAVQRPILLGARVL